MDFLVELLIQLVVEIIGELLIELGLRGVGRALSSFTGRAVAGFSAGLAFGLFWGHHLDGGQHYPKLLWASLFLAGAALLQLTVGDRPQRSAGRRRELVAPPWRWPAQRLLTFVVINAGLALGIVVTFRPSVLG